MTQHIDLGIILLIGLIAWIIYKRTVKDNTMELKKLVILPILFLYLTYSMLTKHFVLVPTDFVTIIIGMIIGAIIGFMVSSNVNVRADHEQNLICVAGSWVNLIIVLIIVAVKFGVGYIISTNPSLSHSGVGKHVLFVLVAAATSLMIGRYLAYYLKYVNATSEHLELPDKKR